MRERVRRRMFPLIASVGLIVIGMYTTTWGPTMMGRTEWALPYDLWGTLIATTRLAHGNIGGLYAPPTGLISLPGAAVILLPVRGPDLGARPVARHPGPAQPAPRGLAGGRAVPDRAVLRHPVRRRRARGAARRALLEAGPARRRERGHPVVGLRPLGPPGGRGRRRAAAVRGPRPGQGAARPGRLARRRGGLRSAPGAARHPGAARLAAVAAHGAVPRSRGAPVGGPACRDGDRQLA